MKLDLKGFAINDAKTPGLRAFRIGQGDDNVGHFRIKRPLQISFRRMGGAFRVGVKNGEQFLPNPSVFKGCRKKCRIDLIRRLAPKRVWQRQKANVVWGPDHHKATGFFRQAVLRVSDHVSKKVRSESKTHRLIIRVVTTGQRWLPHGIG